jgi:hypothetical protein
MDSFQLFTGDSVYRIGRDQGPAGVAVARSNVISPRERGCSLTNAASNSDPFATIFRASLGGDDESCRQARDQRVLLSPSR